MRVRSHFSGWPKVAILTLPREKIQVTIITLVSCYLSPLVISCAIYLIIICQKERHFKNSISVASEIEMKASNVQRKSINAEKDKSEEGRKTVNVNSVHEEIGNKHVENIDGDILSLKIVN